MESLENLKHLDVFKFSIGASLNSFGRLSSFAKTSEVDGWEWKKHIPSRLDSSTHSCTLNCLKSVFQEMAKIDTHYTGKSIDVQLFH